MKKKREKENINYGNKRQKREISKEREMDGVKEKKKQERKDKVGLTAVHQ